MRCRSRELLVRSRTAWMIRGETNAPVRTDMADNYLRFGDLGEELSASFSKIGDAGADPRFAFGCHARNCRN